jgi:hypothetical protein
VVAVIANPFPYKTGLMLGAFAGIAVGLALDLRRRGLNGTEPLAHRPEAMEPLP